MPLIHALNAFLWLINAVMWFGYAHSTVMGLAALICVAGSIAIGAYFERH